MPSILFEGFLLACARQDAPVSQRKLVMRQRRAGINTQKTLESYDFTFNLGVNHAQIMDLATCRYLEEKVPVLIVGPCGTGKSHIAQALGRIAIRRSYDTVFSTTPSSWAARLGAGRGRVRAQAGGADQGGSAHHRRLQSQAHALRAG
jgi:DNA replication protein DnaC